MVPLRNHRIILLAAALLTGIGLPSRALPAVAPPPADPTKVHVESGVLAGVEEGGVLVFRGVPYAAPPVGSLRWKPPQPPIPWTGERSAKSPGPNCMQPVDPAGLSAAGGPVSEDCLTLQVFAPKPAVGSKPAPVMVWLHGGGHTQGAGSKPAYDGTAFAHEGVVLVSINYRLGPLGFFAHSALTRSAKPDEPLASYGLMDQIAALQWVQRNIAIFGGDPGNVTLFGESSGAVDVLTLMSTPKARGLFAKAMAESPGGAWYPLPSLADAEAHGQEAAIKAGATANATADQLRALPADRLIRDMGDDYGPVQDGRLLTESPAQAFVRGHAADLPLILGSNSYEGLLNQSFTTTLADLPAEMRAAYTDQAPPGKPLGDLIFGDRVFTAPVRWFARQASPGAPAWLYRFSYVRESQRGKVPGAPHGSEIPYVFDSWGKISSRAALLPAEVHAMTALVHSCWVAFARTGVPACAGSPAWPAYAPDREELLELSLPPVVRQHLHKPQLDAQEHAAAGILPVATPSN